MFDDEYTLWARLLAYTRHRFFKVHVFLEAPPLSLLWYIRNSILILLASFIITCFTWSFGLDEFDAKALIASMALFVSLLAFIVNYAATIRPSTLLRVRYGSMFSSPFGFTRSDPKGSILDGMPSDDLSGITIYNWSKNDIEIESAVAEVRNASISIQNQAPAQTRTRMPISIAAGKSATIVYDYPRLAWALSCNGEPTRPWLVLTASDGRMHRFPFPDVVHEDMISLKRNRPTPVDHALTHAYHRYHIDGSFDDHTKQIASYMGLSTPSYAVRYRVDPELDFNFRLRTNGRWGSTYTFPNIQDCIDAMIEMRSCQHEPDCHVIFQTRDSETMILAIGTEERLTFATMDHTLSHYGRLLGGSLNDVLEAMPTINDLAGIVLKKPEASQPVILLHTS